MWLTLQLDPTHVHEIEQAWFNQLAIGLAEAGLNWLRVAMSSEIWQLQVQLQV